MLKGTTLGWLFLPLFLGAALPLFADETYYLRPADDKVNDTQFTMHNWHSLSHPLISEFTAKSNGDSYGTTTTGVSFVQYTIPNDAGVRIQRFEIEDHYHYIVNGRIINTIETLSAQLALSYAALSQ